MILSDEVYDRLYYVPFTRIATLSEEIAAQTLTFGSIGKAFYCTGWRVGYVIGPEYLISHVCTAHTRICYAAPGPQQEAAAVGYEEGDSRGFWEEAKTDMKGKIDRFTEVLDELGLPVGHLESLELEIPFPTELTDSVVRAVYGPPGWVLRARQYKENPDPHGLRIPT